MIDTQGKQVFSGTELLKKKKIQLCGALCKGNLSDVTGNVLLQLLFFNSKCNREFISSTLKKYQGLKIEIRLVLAVLGEIFNYYGPNMQL